MPDRDVTERCDPTVSDGAITEPVLVPVSPPMLAQLTAGWSKPVQIKLDTDSGDLVARVPNVTGWLDDIENALRGIWTTSDEEDDAFDQAAESLDALRVYLEVGHD